MIEKAIDCFNKIVDPLFLIQPSWKELIQFAGTVAFLCIFVGGIMFAVIAFGGPK